MNEIQIDERITRFISRLEKLDPGSRARLKHSAGKSFAEVRDLGFFYSLLPPGVPVYQEEKYLLLATVFPIATGGATGDLGSSLKKARLDKKNVKGLDRRIRFLLDSDESQLPFRLRQAIRFLYSNRVKVNWHLLLDDILGWSHPERYVQRRWARSYFSE